MILKMNFITTMYLLTFEAFTDRWSFQKTVSSTRELAVFCLLSTGKFMMVPAYRLYDNSGGYPQRAGLPPFLSHLQAQYWIAC